MKTIEIDDSVFEDLGKIAIPFVENSPNLVIKRLIEQYYKYSKTTCTDKPILRRRSHRRGYGKLSSEHYRGPIIETLNDLGGAGNVDEIMEKVFAKVSHLFSDIDLSVTLNGYVRWKLTAQWERHLMVRDGILKADSPHGIWELTPEYIESLKKNTIKSAEATDTEV